MATANFRQAHDRTFAIGRLAVMLAFAVFFLFPIVFMFVSSFKPDEQIFGDLVECLLGGRRGGERDRSLVV